MNFLISKVLVGFVVLVLLAACSDGTEQPEGDVETTLASEETDSEATEVATSEEAEVRVRELVLLDGQELTSTLTFDSDDAIANAAQVVPVEIADLVEVGDFYLAFDDIQVLYRPSADRVVQTVAVLRSTDGAGNTELRAETTSTTVAVESDAEDELPDDLEEIDPGEPAVETIP